MKHQSLFCVLSGGMIAFSLLSAGITASAYTADDVAAKARQAGWPETLIQTGYNQWASGEYTQAQLDAAYDSVSTYNEQTEELIYNSLGLDPEEARKKNAEKQNAPTETEPATEAPAKDSVQENNSAENTTVSNSDFIDMSMEEKKAYVDSLPDDQKAEFIDSLSPEARNSIIKQLPAEDKAVIIQKYVDAADSMGMNVTVDHIGEKDISLTVRNQDGIVIDKAAVGVVIDETGISHTKPFLFAGIGILLSLAGFGGLYWYARHTEEN